MKKRRIQILETQKLRILANPVTENCSRQGITVAKDPKRRPFLACTEGNNLFVDDVEGQDTEGVVGLNAARHSELVERALRHLAEFNGIRLRQTKSAVWKRVEWTPSQLLHIKDLG